MVTSVVQIKDLPLILPALLSLMLPVKWLVLEAPAYERIPASLPPTSGGRPNGHRAGIASQPV